MLFARMQGASGVEAEAFYQTAFKPSVLDLCGTLWAVTDYTAEGCNRTFSGAVPVSDRGRLASGSYLKRIASPTATDRSQFGAALPVDGLLGHAWAAFTHDVKGWSYDFQINQGRRAMTIGTRADYRQRYFAELVFMPVWGGRYNSQVDRDQLSVAVGTRF